MNFPHIPRRIRRNPNWLKRAAQLIGNYRYWRSRGNTIRSSWWLAKHTL